MGNLQYHIDHSRILPSSEIMAYIRHHWGWFLVSGLLLIILGCLSLGSVFLTSLYSVIVLGFFMGVSGVVQLFEGIQTRRWSGFFFHLLLGLVYISAAAVIFMTPGISLITITFIIAALFFSAGLFRMISALVLRFRQWGWTFCSGLIAIALAVMILNSWPASSLWVIGTFVGIDLMFYHKYCCLCIFNKTGS
jgi:uncharacterized membrane protein HdeD (DUF308 family)